MRSIAILSVASFVIAVACTPAAPPAAQQAPAPAKEVPQPAPPSPEAEWERVVEEAQREGRVGVLGPPGADIREALVGPFQERFGIEVDYLGGRAGEVLPRIAAERDAGQFLWDVYVSGTTGQITILKPMGGLDPLEPALILPEVKDPSNWLEGQLWFADRDRMIKVMALTSRPSFAFNPNTFSVEDFTSYRDLLDPRFRGQLSMGRDPRIPGPSNAIFTFYYLHPDLGPDFIRELVQQEITNLGDDRAALDALARGSYLVDIAPEGATAEELIRAGVPIELMPPQQLREGGYLSPVSSAMGLMNQAPNPNAARVYINWLLSPEGQDSLARATQVPSLRVDVPADYIDDWRKPDPSFIDTYSEDPVLGKDAVDELLDEVFGPR